MVVHLANCSNVFLIPDKLLIESNFTHVIILPFSLFNANVDFEHLQSI